jgi:hypothetical protein
VHKKAKSITMIQGSGRLAKNATNLNDGAQSVAKRTVVQLANIYLALWHREVLFSIGRMNGIPAAGEKS